MELQERLSKKADELFSIAVDEMRKGLVALQERKISAYEMHKGGAAIFINYISGIRYAATLLGVTLPSEYGYSDAHDAARALIKAQ